MDAASGLWLLPFASGIGEFAKHETMCNVPSNSWKLAYAISHLRGNARESKGHLNSPGSLIIAGLGH